MKICLFGLFFAASAFSAEPARSTTAVAGSEYKANAFHRFFFGDHWRDLWTSPMQVPYLNLKTFGGGLTPTKLGGGKQTKSLRFMGKDGKEYKFRGINKDPSKALPPELRDSLLADIVQDQISTSNPLAPLVVAPIANALGVFQTEPVLVVIPDDAALGEFRQSFKNVLGTIEENPRVYDDGDSTFENADKIIGTFKLFKRLERDNKEQVDAKAYLRARLMDMFLGDWDRHQKQWRWARIEDEEGRLWRPIARDRDQAFARYDGILPWFATQNVRQLNGATESYPRIEALTWSGRYVDRRLLVSVNKADWDAVTQDVVSKLDNALISKAVHRLPAEMYVLEGANLERVLRSRRDKLKESSEDFYHLLASYVDIRGSEKNDLLEINRIDADHTRVTLYKIKSETGKPKKEPFYDRTFDAHETKELRIYLLGGKDQTVYSGYPKNGISVQLIPGESTSQSATQSDEERFEPPRDYGYDWWFQPLFKASTDEGVLLGGGPVLYKYGLNQFPYVYRMQARAGYAFGVNKYYFDYNGEFLSVFRPLNLVIDAKASELEVQNYFGSGNESIRKDDLEGQGFYKLRQSSYVISPKLQYPRLGPVTAYVGPAFRFTTIKTDDTTLAKSTRPYGIDDNMLFSAESGFRVDTRDSKVFPAKGFYLNAGGGYFPQSFDNPHGYGRLKGEARTYFSWKLITETTLSFRAGAERIIGQHPFYDSAYLGGDATMRGFRRNRFAGDASVYGGPELKLFLARFKFLFPAKLGIHGFTDLGRVFVNSDESHLLHKTFGGGIWTSFAASDYTMVVTYAKSAEMTIMSLGVGSAF